MSELRLHCVLETGLISVPVAHDPVQDSSMGAERFITLEDHPHFGSRGTKWYEDRQYRLSIGEAKKIGIESLARACNTYLARLQVVTKTIQSIK